jgi:hypothetical protein
MVALALAVASSSALAYAPTPGFVMNLVAIKRAKQKLEALRVTLKRTDVVGGAAQEPVEVTVTYRSGGRVRREWTDKDGKHARISDATRAVAVDGDKRSKAAAEPNVFDALWATGGEGDEREAALNRAVGVLAAYGVGEGVAFSRVDGRVAWVVGGSAPNTPQVWVDKDDFLPLRFVCSEGARKEGEVPKGPWVDVRLRSWGSALGGEFYPARVETWRDGVLVRTEELVKVDVTPKIDERDFKLD